MYEPAVTSATAKGRILRWAVLLVVVGATATLVVSAPAQAQDDGGGGDGGDQPDSIADAVGDLPYTPPGSGWLAERIATGGDGDGDSGGGDNSGGSGDGSGSGGDGGGGVGSTPGPGGEAGQGTDDTGGEYGAWTEPINIAQGLVFIVTGIGLVTGIITVGTASGSTELHAKGMKMIGGTLAGFIIGSLAVQIYNLLGDVVIGF